MEQDMIYRYESGRSDPPLSRVEALADFYGMQLGDIFQSSRPRSQELIPILVALEDFEPEERSAVIERTAGEMRFLSTLAKGRVARHLVKAIEEFEGGRVGKPAEIDTPTDEAGRTPPRFHTPGGPSDVKATEPRRKGRVLRDTEPKEKKNS